MAIFVGLGRFFKFSVTWSGYMVFMTENLPWPTKNAVA